ncbi:MAG: hypothetical protein WC974_09840 [Thermoplasmata archaeon]
MTQDIKITFKEEIPKELEGKTLKEMFYICCEKNREIAKKISNIKSHEDIEKVLNKDEIMYLRIIQMFAEIIREENKENKLNLISPFQKL